MFERAKSMNVWALFDRRRWFSAGRPDRKAASAARGVSLSIRRGTDV